MRNVDEVFAKEWIEYRESAEEYDDNSEQMAKRFFVKGLEQASVKNPSKRKIIQMLEHCGQLHALCDDGKLYCWKAHFINDEFREYWVELPRPFPQE